MYMEKVPVFVFSAVLVAFAFVFMINSSETPAPSVTGYFVNSGPPQQDSDTAPKDDGAAANSDTPPTNDVTNSSICTEPPDGCAACAGTCTEHSYGDYNACYMCCTANECDAANSDRICSECI